MAKTIQDKLKELKDVKISLKNKINMVFGGFYNESTDTVIEDSDSFDTYDDKLYDSFSNVSKGFANAITSKDNKIELKKDGTDTFSELIDAIGKITTESKVLPESEDYYLAIITDDKFDIDNFDISTFTYKKHTTDEILTPDKFKYISFIIKEGKDLTVHYTNGIQDAKPAEMELKEETLEELPDGLKHLGKEWKRAHYYRKYPEDGGNTVKSIIVEITGIKNK